METEVKNYKVQVTYGKTESLPELGIKDYSNYTFSSSNPGCVTIDKSGKQIFGKESGKTIITLYKNETQDTKKTLVAKLEVAVVHDSIPLGYDLSKQIVISEKSNLFLVNNGIYSLNDILEKWNNSSVREQAAQTIQYETVLLLRQASMWQVPKMTRELAYLCALVGVRNPAELAKVDPSKLLDAFKIVQSSVFLAYPDFRFPTQYDIVTIIESAQHMNGNFFDYYQLDGGLPETPSSLMSGDMYVTGTNHVINEGLKFLENIKIALPLPRTISGYVRIKPSRYSEDRDATGIGGLLVSISGISDPSIDKKENEIEYSCLTRPKDGYFSIVMPDKYNMQETVTISVSKKNNMSYAIAGQSTSYKIDFVKRASELLQNEKLKIDYDNEGKKYDEPIEVKASKILSTINEVRTLNSKAMEIERVLRTRAYRTYARAGKKDTYIKAKEKVDKCKRNIEEEFRYHVKRTYKQIYDAVYDSTNGAINKEIAKELGIISEAVKTEISNDIVKVAKWDTIIGTVIHESLQEKGVVVKEGTEKNEWKINESLERVPKESRFFEAANVIKTNLAEKAEIGKKLDALWGEFENKRAVEKDDYKFVLYFENEFIKKYSETINEFNLATDKMASSLTMLEIPEESISQKTKGLREYMDSVQKLETICPKNALNGYELVKYVDNIIDPIYKKLLNAQHEWYYDYSDDSSLIVYLYNLMLREHGISEFSNSEDPCRDVEDRYALASELLQKHLQEVITIYNKAICNGNVHVVDLGGAISEPALIASTDDDDDDDNNTGYPIEPGIGEITIPWLVDKPRVPFEPFERWPYWYKWPPKFVEPEYIIEHPEEIALGRDVIADRFIAQKEEIVNPRVDIIEKPLDPKDKVFAKSDTTIKRKLASENKIINNVAGIVENGDKKETGVVFAPANQAVAQEPEMHKKPRYVICTAKHIWLDEVPCEIMKEKVNDYLRAKKELLEAKEAYILVCQNTELIDKASEEEKWFHDYLESEGTDRRSDEDFIDLEDSVRKNAVDDLFIDFDRTTYEKEHPQPTPLPRRPDLSLSPKNGEDNVVPEEVKKDPLVAEYKAIIEQCESKLKSIYALENIIEYNPDDYADSGDGSAVNGTRYTTSNQVERCILNFLNTPFDSEFRDAFIISEEDFEDESLHPRALPSVKFMGDGNREVYLPTDTAPSRMFNYTMVHRLVEPTLKKKNVVVERSKMTGALKIDDFKKNIGLNPEDATIASSLGIGYALNMHQAWVPDGFALGNLLYSLILAPGEEQRLIVREHKEEYRVSNEATAMDNIADSYSNSQIDNETAAFNNAVDRYSSAHSDSSYYSKATSKGGTGIHICFGIGATSSSTSVNQGWSNANSSQRDSYDEASSTAQNFQTSIKTESERIASAHRTSISVATSEETEALSSRIIANHNHSHVMTVQYWEVARRYRLETCIDSVELMLFVPLELVKFAPNMTTDPMTHYYIKNDNAALSMFNKSSFEMRYGNILRYYDIILDYIPPKYRTGLDLIKKFSAIPYWKPEPVTAYSNEKYTISVIGNFCEFDSLTATLYFNNGKHPVEGFLTNMSHHRLKTKEGKNPHTRQETIQAIIDARNKECRNTATFSFSLPYGCSHSDIAQISIKNTISTWNYNLSQAPKDMESWERDAVYNYEDKLEDLYQDDKSSRYDLRKIAHYEPGLPECYTNPVVTFTPDELYSLGNINIRILNEDISGKIENTEKNENENEESTFFEKLKDAFESNNINYSNSTFIASGVLGSSSLTFSIDNTYPTLRIDDIRQIEETFHHIVSDTMYYSQAVWASLTDDERILLLEPYTIEFDDLEKIAAPDVGASNFLKEKSISLLNCVNAKKVIGFYGNCMMLPFTFPKELVDLIGKTSGDIQDELYRYHSCNFRVPSTTVSVPTNGMVGEAVLGATNVSEKIDITRFWNWKDSDIDHIELNQSSLNGRSLLENASAQFVDAPTVGVTATEHVNGNNLASALIARQQPTFADVYTNTDMRDVMKNADNNASAGREQVVQSTSELAKAALDAAVQAGTMAATGGLSGAAGGLTGAAGSSGGITSLLGSLSNAGLGDADVGTIFKNFASGGGLEGAAKSIVSMINGGDTGLLSTDQLKKVASSIDKDSLLNIMKSFVSNSDTASSLADNFSKSIASLASDKKDFSTSDIIGFSKEFCSDNNIELDSFASQLGKLLGIIK